MMQMFYSSILYVLFFTIIFSSIIGYILIRNKNKNNKKYPPQKSVCPDLWTIVTDKNGETVCQAKDEALLFNYPSEHNLNKCNVHDGKVCFKTTISDGDTCNLYKNRKNWAHNCKISWDGVSNIV
tara:strand:- start:371 stop:745 length:375 start_codon:yes stop_codon:yes gene_type:complete